MKRVLALFIAALCVAGCKKGDGGQPNAAAVKEMLSAFVKPGADQAALSTKLRPQDGDYDAVFVGDAAKTFKANVDPGWDAGNMVIKPGAEQTEIDVSGATPEQLKKGEGNATACPAGYKSIADKLDPKIVVYCARFKKPGENAGMTADAIVWVKDHWAYFPKPFRSLTGAPPASAPASPSSSAK
jgi:hypothetical protein